MPDDATRPGVSFELIETWLAARSLSRGLPMPVRDRGGLRVDTGMPHELRRHVFVKPDGLRALARSLRVANVPLKLCGPAAVMRAHLPPGWKLRPPAYVMTCGGVMAGSGTVPPGYELDIRTDGPVGSARVTSADGEVAATGRSAAYRGVFIYDQIVTAAGHRRIGLGRAVMKGLEAAGRGEAALQMLVATEAGRALYEPLGWTVVSDYTTAEFVGEDD